MTDPKAALEAWAVARWDSMWEFQWRHGRPGFVMRGGDHFPLDDFYTGYQAAHAAALEAAAGVCKRLADKYALQGPLGTHPTLESDALDKATEQIRTLADKGGGDA